jgi:hypothetical protein
MFIYFHVFGENVILFIFIRKMSLVDGVLKFEHVHDKGS